MENSSVLSIDSLGESELDRLRDKLKQKDHIIAEKSEIINSLRQQVNDLNHDLEEIENNQQFLTQKVDRLTKDLATRDEELEAVSHALREVEAANEKLTKRMEARTGQIQKFVEDLVAAKKELEETRGQNEDLKHKNEQLTIELEMVNARKRSLQEHEEQLKQQLLHQQEEQERQRKQTIEYKPQIRDGRNTHCRKGRQNETRTTGNDGNRPELASALHFQMADEIGEIMDSSSAFPPPMPFSDNHQDSRNHYSKLTTQVKQEPAIWSPKVSPDSIGNRASSFDNHHDVKKHPQLIRQVQSLNNENSNANANYCENHHQKRIQTFDNQISDPIAEYKMRLARAAELARRNMQTKPLHQTSYPLELDTFDTTDLTEQEIKRGNVMKQSSRPPQRLPPQPPVPNNHSLDTPPQQQPKLRQALSNCSNTPPVVRRVYKKAEAFIV